MINRELQFLMAKWRNEVTRNRRAAREATDVWDIRAFNTVATRLERAVDEIEEILEAHTSTKMTIDLTKVKGTK